METVLTTTAHANAHTGLQPTPAPPARADSGATAQPQTSLSSSLQDHTSALLNHAFKLLHEGNAVAAFRLLGAPLSALWSEARGSARGTEMQAQCAAHPLHALVQQDPYTHRAATKPRGYAGDAVMMDYIYDGQAPAGTSLMGSAIFTATTRASMGLSVLYRRQLLKSLIDDTVVTHEAGRVLSVASGHCRELVGSLVNAPFFSGEFVALDQDALSCAEVAHCHADGRVRVLHAGVRELLAGSMANELGGFDLVYSAGLFDYLPDGLARRLTAQLLKMLRPGGRLVIANFVPTGSGRGYMELFMDWSLVLRDQAAMHALALSAGAATVNSFHDPHHNVVYAELRREAGP